MKNIANGVSWLAAIAFMIKAITAVYHLFPLEIQQTSGSEAYSAGYFTGRMLTPLGYFGLSYLIFKKFIKKDLLLINH